MAMKPEEVLLKLILDAVGCQINKWIRPDRKFVQNIIYLIQVNGADLKYNYQWDDGDICPYSGDLWWTHNLLNASLNNGERDYTWYKLSEDADPAIEKTRRIMIVPHDVPISISDWVAFLSAAHYLITSRHRPDSISDADIYNYLKKHYKRVSLINPNVVRAVQSLINPDAVRADQSVDGNSRSASALYLF